MTDPVIIDGPALQPEQLIDIEPHQQSWQLICDQVMGGLSEARLLTQDDNGLPSHCLVGRTRLENNGGFVQIKQNIQPQWLAASYSGVFIELRGTQHQYNVHLKTQQLTKPWQSFRHTLTVSPQWTRFHLPFAQLQPHRTEAALFVPHITSIAVVAIGEAFDVNVCVRRVGFYTHEQS
ncbi:MAG: CIA30 family protein [Oceanisphaera sp.]